MPRATFLPRNASRAAPHLIAVAVYALLAVLVTWPVLPNFRSGVVGAVGGVDAYQNAWNLWWIGQALPRGESPFWSPLLFYPDGVDLFWQTLGFSQGVVALPVTLTLGPLAAVNWTVLTSFVLGGYFTWLFARHVLKSEAQNKEQRTKLLLSVVVGNKERPTPSAGSRFSVLGSVPSSIVHRPSSITNAAALVAGAVFAFSPFHLEKVIDGNIEVAAIQWIPAYAFALHLLLERPTLWRALLSGMLLLWVSLGSWYYGTFCVLYTGCVVVVWAVRALLKRDEGRRTNDENAIRPLSSVLRPLIGFAPLIIWAVVLAPRLIGLAQSGDTLQDMRSIQAERSADLLDFFLPSPVNPWWGASVRAARAAVYPNAVIWNVALGSVGLVLGGIGALACRRRAWPWLLLLLLTMLLALGPVLRVAGYTTGLPLPFALIQNLPGIRAGQRPNHMAVLSNLMLALLAAYGTAWLLRKMTNDERRTTNDKQRFGSFIVHRPSSFVSRLIALTLVVAIVAIDGNARPLRIVERPVHPFYATLPPPDGALMPLPLYVNINRSENLTPQMTHGWPILGGYVARPPRYPFAQYTPGVRELQDGQAERDDIVTPGWPESGRRALAAYRIRYVTLDRTSDKDAYFAQVRALLQELGVGPPLVADAVLEAYAVPRAWPIAPLLFLGAGWQPVEQQPDAGLRWRWMGDEAELRLFNPFERPVAATITLTSASYRQTRPLRLAFDGADLGALDVPADRPATRQVRLLLRPGEHSLMLHAAAEPDPGRANAPISVRVFDTTARFSAPLQ